jgi:hypothetical protein
MTGYKLITKEYSGKVTGDEVIYTHKEAADYLFAQFKAEAAACPRPEEAAEIKMETVTYVQHNFAEGRIGRVIHQLNRSTRKDCVRETALSKLTQEEIDAIQDPR